MTQLDSVDYIIQRVNLSTCPPIERLAKHVLFELTDIDRAPRYPVSVLAKFTEGAKTYIASDEHSESIGFMALRATYGQLEASVDYLYVDRACRKRGLGRELLGKAEEVARNIGSKVLWLTPLNDALYDFYINKCGYARVDCGEHARYVEKQL